MLEAYIDGACEPKNPGGTASYGVLVLRKSLERYGEGPMDVEPIEEPVWESSRIVGSGPKMSNNVAEYTGLIAFLEWYGNYSDEPVTIFSDSQMLVSQMSGKMKVRQGLYVPYFEKAMGLMAVLVGQHWPKPEFKWIPGKENPADELSVRALEKVGIYRRSR